jgi:hypothetical protein
MKFNDPVELLHSYMQLRQTIREAGPKGIDYESLHMAMIAAKSMTTPPQLADAWALHQLIEIERFLEHVHVTVGDEAFRVWTCSHLADSWHAVSQRPGLTTRSRGWLYKYGSSVAAQVDRQVSEMMHQRRLFTRVSSQPTEVEYDEGFFRLHELR